MKPVRILHLEDDDNDAVLIGLELASQAWPHEVTLTQTQEEFSAALDRSAFDVILADNSGPLFSGHDALSLARKKCPGAVFLFVSGVEEGDTSVAAMKSGSDGYVLKHRLTELVPAIQRALQGKNK